MIDCVAGAAIDQEGILYGNQAGQDKLCLNKGPLVPNLDRQHLSRVPGVKGFRRSECQGLRFIIHCHYKSAEEFVSEYPIYFDAETGFKWLQVGGREFVSFAFDARQGEVYLVNEFDRNAPGAGAL